MKLHNMDNFYAVVGKNGVTIVDTWEKARKEDQYLRHTTAYGFDTFKEAEDWILKMFPQWFPQVAPPSSLKLNWAYYVKKNHIN